MCIRDRGFVGGAEGRQVHPLLEADPELPRHVPRHLAQRGVCLLYTSDAADELHCVDLGGPRIIKKKKYNYRNSNITNTTRHIIPIPCLR